MNPTELAITSLHPSIVNTFVASPLSRSKRYERMLYCRSKYRQLSELLQPGVSRGLPRGAHQKSTDTSREVIKRHANSIFKSIISARPSSVLTTTYVLMYSMVAPILWSVQKMRWLCLHMLDLSPLHQRLMTKTIAKSTERLFSELRKVINLLFLHVRPLVLLNPLTTPSCSVTISFFLKVSLVVS